MENLSTAYYPTGIIGQNYWDKLRHRSNHTALGETENPYSVGIISRRYKSTSEGNQLLAFHKRRGAEMTQRITQSREQAQEILDEVRSLSGNFNEFKTDMSGDMKELKMKVDLTFGVHDKRITKQEENISWLTKSVIGLIIAEIIMKVFSI